MKKLQAMRAVFDAELTHTEKLVWLAILDHADASGWAWPSVTRIAERSGVSEATVRRTLRELEGKVAEGLRVERSSGGRESNRYHLGETIELRSGGHGKAKVHPDPPHVEPSHSEPPQAEPSHSEPPQAEPSHSDHDPSHGERAALSNGAPHTLLETGHRSRPRKQAIARARGATRPKRWTRAPEDFEPNADHERIAAERGVDLALELAKFRDHDFARPRSDPDATFRNWLRNATSTRANGARASPRPVQRGPAADLSHAENNRFISRD